MYPEEHGADLALLWLTAFPQNTLFKRIDDIDRCNLLFADVKFSNRSDPFDRRNFHVAIWHEDLLELAEQEFIDGVSPVSERRWQAIWRAELPEDLSFRLPDGSYKPIDFPALEDYDDEGMSWPEFTGSGVVVTSRGRSRAASLLSKEHSLVSFGNKIERLMRVGYFDTAVREACVDLEHRMRVWLRTGAFGDVLVEEFVVKLRDENRALESSLRVLRGEVRATFRFIRNDFMHNFVDIDETQARAILFRLWRVRSVLEEVMGDGT